MQIDINKLKEVDLWPLAGNELTHGKNAGDTTFKACLSAPLILDTPDKIFSAKIFLQEFGAWPDIDTWPDVEVNALIVQFVASDLRDAGYCDILDLTGEPKKDLPERISRAGKAKYYYDLS